jgi:drug/metabolite transporter (DMT)-like permease
VAELRRATPLFAAAALCAFAANSLLCRLALGAREIDALSFTVLRLGSGAAMMALLLGQRIRRLPGSWGGAVALFAYAAPFSLAYVRIGAGVGALLLFTAVQSTMIGWGMARGERPVPREWLGLAAAAGGLAFLAVPGASAPDPVGAALMVASGVCWGIYSLRGRGAGDPLATTAGNFVRAVPASAALLVLAIATGAAHATARGVALAVASGAVASGLGYVAWYAALRGLTATRAALIQLPVPVMTATGAVVLLGESVTMRLAVASAAILGGVALAITRPSVGAVAGKIRRRGPS